MNKHSRLVIAAIITIILVSLAYLLFTRTTSAPRQSAVDKQTQTQTQTQTTDATPAPTIQGTYTTYSADKVTSTKGTKLLFFHAPWCPQCRDLEASIDSDGIPSGVTIFKVDYDSNQALRQQYGVTIQTTVVKIDDEGNKVDSFVAYDDPSAAAVERELLQ